MGAISLRRDRKIAIVDWDTLRIVLHIHREGSLNAAARVLRLSQPTVSRHLAKAENSLKSRLFDRRNRGLVATTAGLMVVEEAMAIEQSLGRMQDQVGTLDNEISGPINISIPQHVMPYLLADEIRDFQAAHPGVEFGIHISDALEDFRNGKVDIVVRAEENPAPSFWGKRIATLQYGYFASPSMAEDINQTWPDLTEAKAPLIVHEGLLYSSAAEIKELFPSGHVVATTNNLGAQVALIEAGMGVGRLPYVIANKLRYAQEITSVQSATERSLWILTHKDMKSIKRISLFIDFVTQRLADRANLFEAQAVEGKKPLRTAALLIFTRYFGLERPERHPTLGAGACHKSTRVRTDENETVLFTNVETGSLTKRPCAHYAMPT